jgi:hypothetical protein
MNDLDELIPELYREAAEQLRQSAIYWSSPRGSSAWPLMQTPRSALAPQAIPMASFFRSP